MDYEEPSVWHNQLRPLYRASRIFIRCVPQGPRLSSTEWASGRRRRGGLGGSAQESHGSVRCVCK
eukprot:151829-Hanusia_phi.AAC.1